MKKYSFIALILFFKSGFCQQITLQTLLKEMIEEGSVVRWPKPFYVLKEVSSYDRRSVSPAKPGWFANDDYSNFIRIDEKQNGKEYIMFDADGPGAIVRFWLTTTAKPGKMRFYFDNEEKPSLEIPAFDLMKAGFNLGPDLLQPHTSYQPNGIGGNTLYLPVPYQKHCKITWTEPDTPQVKQKRYYQINYRTFAAGTNVETFSMNALSSAKALIAKVENTLWNRPDFKAVKTININKNINPGEEMEVPLPEGASAIRALHLKLQTTNKDDYAKALRSTILKIEFDGKETVWCPISDFSGSGEGAKPLKSWYREVDNNGTIISRWIMPYRQRAKISIVNSSKSPVHVFLAAALSGWKWDDRCMYFHAKWKQELNLKDTKWDYDVTKATHLDTAAPKEWNFITIKGRGVYLGNTLNIFNHMHTWYGEGDHKIWVDRDTFPSEFGTGLEDYYNTSWAPVVLYQTPFANAPRADNKDSYGFNTFTRTRILDAVPFNQFFKYDMEMLSWETGTIDCRVTTYWYAFSNTADNGITEKDKIE